jgi:predicted secreted protein
MQASTLKKYSLRDLILDIKIPWMKFNEDIIVFSETMNRNKVLGGMWNMNNIFKMQIFRGGVTNCMTNMTNAHTLSICHVNLLMALVLLSHGELVELTDDVVGGASVAIPIGVHALRHRISTLFLLLLLFFFFFFFFFVDGVTVPTLPGFMAWLATDLAC